MPQVETDLTLRGQTAPFPNSGKILCVFATRGNDAADSGTWGNQDHEVEGFVLIS